MNDDARRCTGHNRDKSRCKNPRVLPTTKCWKHGGHSPRGVASPHYQGKGRSRSLPVALRDKYLAAINDPELLAVDKDIALMDLRMDELAGKLQASDMGQLWVDAHEAWLAMEAAQGVGDVATMREHWGTVGALIKRAANQYHLWQEMMRWAQGLTRLRLSEHKRLVDMQVMMSHGQMLMVMGTLMTAIRDAHTKRLDAKLSREILAEVQATVQKMTESPRQAG